MSKFRRHKVHPTVESPTWGHVQRMAEAVMRELGGPSGAASKLNAESFYALSILASLKLNQEKAAAYILGRQYIS